jgi:hypothetical protein
MHANLSLSVWSVDLSGVAMEAGVALHCPCIIRHYGKNCVRPGREKGEEGRTLILGRVAVKKLNTHNRCRRLDRRDRCKLIRQSERVPEGQRISIGNVLTDSSFGVSGESPPVEFFRHARN